MWIKVKYRHEEALVNMDYVKEVTKGEKPNTCIFTSEQGWVVINEDINVIYSKIKDAGK